MTYLGRIFRVFGDSEKDAVTNIAAIMSGAAAMIQLLIETDFFTTSAHRYVILLGGLAGILLGGASGRNNKLTGVSKDV
jgi:hypothetical protein